jgi:hypothetical protein
MLRSQPALQTFAAKAKLRPDRTYTPRDKAAFCRCGYDEDGIRQAELGLRRAEKGLSEREGVETSRAETQQHTSSSPLQKPKD